jgi:O-antigen/teichoic acid export membrane protein
MSKGNVQPLTGGETSRLLHIVFRLTLFGFRGISTVAKFILALYVTRYLGLADLGIYGLVAAACALTPAILGFGLTEWISRQIVLDNRIDALRKMSARLSITVVAHIVFQPLFWAANFALGSPVPAAWIWLIAPIVLLEHLFSDIHDLLNARGHVGFASALQFVRAGMWPLLAVGVGLLYPETRTLDSVLVAWLFGLTLAGCIFLAWLLTQGAGPLLRRPEISRQIVSARSSVSLYLRNIASNASLLLDRYLISLTLGLELTGVYVFFWSVANVVHGMIISVVIQPQAPTLIGSAARSDMTGFHDFARKLRLEAIAWTLLMSAGAFGVVVVLLPFLQRPLLQAYLPVFALIIIATWARIASEKYVYVLLALHRDRAILIASAVGMAMSAVLNLVLIPTFGLWGAASAFLLTGLTVLVLGIMMSRNPAATHAIART